MGNFYVNTAVRAPIDAVAETLRGARLRAYVAPEHNGSTVYADEVTNAQDDHDILRLGQKVSARLSAAALTVLDHDDDILAYWLFESGRLADRYNSDPGYFTGAQDLGPEGGDAVLLAQAFDRPEAAPDLDAVLRETDPERFLFEIDRHVALCAALGLPESVAGLGYEYAKQGDFADDPWLKDALRV